MIRRAHPDDLAALAAVETSAATRFAGTAMAFVMDHGTTPADALESAMHAGCLWVADDGQLQGFLLAEAIAEWLHILELSVSRPAQGRGLGRAMLAAAVAAAPALGCERLSLTTDRFLEWNGPFYARQGFAEVGKDGLPDWLAALPAREAASGLDPARRCIMMRAL
ncbi:GNAT family N-acetyltransferase [Sandarakinorhabdus sp.]|uniref:GNAT family N-acetyltransferase n=1 Tax=Sandarakinorhabdus sp. TaxID=1916663 RepID=UPI00286D8752|nr:GNAT family N-acetyltransferase [Sandarakinorhabdus sp.]